MLEDRTSQSEPISTLAQVHKLHVAFTPHSCPVKLLQFASLTVCVPFGFWWYNLAPVGI